MGLIKLAIVGGAGYWAYQKYQAQHDPNHPKYNPNGRRCGGRRSQSPDQQSPVYQDQSRGAPEQYRNQDGYYRDHPDTPHPGQYRDDPYYVHGRDMSQYFNIKPEYREKQQMSQQQRYYDFEPDYSQERKKSLPAPPVTETYPREKQEYQKNF